MYASRFPRRNPSCIDVKVVVTRQEGFCSLFSHLVAQHAGAHGLYVLAQLNYVLFPGK